MSRTALLNFHKLARPKEWDFTVTPWPGRSTDLIAKNRLGRPVVLVLTAANGQAWPIRLQHLSVDYAQKIESKPPIQGKDGAYVVLTCEADEGPLHTLFFQVVESVLNALPPAPSMDDIQGAVRHLRALFAPLTRPGLNTIQGLWAELFIAIESENPAQVFGAWRQSTTDRFDFNAGRERVEVKSYRARRVHAFSDRQLVEHPETSTLIASIQLESSPRGASLGELVSVAGILLGSTPMEVRRRVEQSILETLGTGWAQGLDTRFDLAVARSSLKFIPLQSVPKLPNELPPAIESVRVMIDFTNLVQPNDLGGHQGLHQSLTTRISRLTE